MKDIKQEYKKQIISIMGVGIQNIKEGSYFVEYLNIDRRTLKHYINELRKEFPIVSRNTKPCGYYIATKESEINEYINNLQSYIHGCEENIKNMQSHLKGAEDVF